MKKLGLLVIMAFFLSLLMALAVSAAPKGLQYEAIPLPVGFQASDLNNHGEVIGGFSEQAAIWSQKSTTLLETEGYSGSYGIAINDRGDYVLAAWNRVDGEITENDTLVFQGKSIEKMTFYSEFSWAYASRMNNKGLVIGTMYSSVQERLAGFIWQDGLVFEMETNSVADINDSNVCVGGYGDYRMRAFSYGDGWLTWLPTPDYFASTAVAINNKGDIAGNVWNINGINVAIWSKGQLTVLESDKLSAEAVDINDHGDVIGFITDNAGDRWAAIWQNGLPTYLNAPAGIKVTSLYRINDKGEILCYGRPQTGLDGYFLLKPR